MKQIITWISRLLIVATVTTGPAQAQTSEAKVVAYMKTRGWEPTSENRFAYLSEGSATTWRCRKFYAGVEYAIVAFSQDGDVTDMDVDVRHCDGRHFDSDNDVDDWGIVVFTGGGGTMDYRMKNYSSDTPDGESRCQYIIFCR